MPRIKPHKPNNSPPGTPRTSRRSAKRRRRRHDLRTSTLSAMRATTKIATVTYTTIVVPCGIASAAAMTCATIIRRTAPHIRARTRPPPAARSRSARARARPTRPRRRSRTARVDGHEVAEDRRDLDQQRVRLRAPRRGQQREHAAAHRAPRESRKTRESAPTHRRERR